MYNEPCASVLWFLLVLMLSVYTWGYFWPTYIHRSNTSYLGIGVYKVVSEPRLSHPCTTSRQINGKEICKWNAWIPVIQSKYKYRVIFSFLIVLFLISKSFPSSRFSFPSSLYQLMIWVDKRCSGRVLNEAIICSLWPTQWSSGILRIDLRSGYLSEVSNLVSLWLFYILGYIFQSDQRLVFGILNYRSSLLCLVLSGYSLSSVFRSILGITLSIHHIRNSITDSSSSTASGLLDKEIISC